MSFGIMQVGRAIKCNASSSLFPVIHNDILHMSYLDSMVIFIIEKLAKLRTQAIVSNSQMIPVSDFDI